jgi:hypothetical protein
LAAVKRLDNLERRVCLITAVVAAAASIGLWAPSFFQAAALILAAAGLAIAGLLAFAARRGSRFLAGLATFLLSFVPWPISLIGMPFLGLGMWLWFRGRPSPEEIAERRAQRAAAVAAKRAAKRGVSSTAADTKRPPPSKRYTPPARRR